MPVFIYLLFSCEKSGGEAIVDTEINRTVIVYLGRDNSDLHQQWEDKKDAMISGWSGKNGNLIIFEDIKDVGVGLYKAIKNNKFNQYVELDVSDIGENSADPNVLSAVLQRIITDYPADSYGLIVFSHGTGWLPEGNSISPRSIIKDNEDEMEIDDFARALPQDKKFDFIVFEACFMAGIEVACELRDRTDFILASSAEIASPGFREVCANYMDYFFLQSADLYSFAEKAFEWVNSQSGAWKSGTLSLIKTSELYELEEWIRQNIDLEKGVDININEIQSFDRNHGEQFYFDFEDYFSRLLKDGVAPSKLTRQINNSVIYKASTPYFFYGISGGFEIKSHSGITTYIPQEQYPEINRRYTEMQWYKAVLQN